MQYEKIISSHDHEISNSVEKYATFGGNLAHWENGTTGLFKKEKTSSKIEDKLDQDMNDVVEYTKWITSEMQKLKDRVKAAESVISDLKTSGEASVESLMETLYILKVKQEELESQGQVMRDNIKNKEINIKLKEEEKAAIKASVEVENADRENQIASLRKQLDEQRQLLDGQRKLLNELQVLCEFTQNDITKANRELHKEDAQTEQLVMQYQETDQATTTLKAKHGQLENQLNGLR